MRSLHLTFLFLVVGGFALVGCTDDGQSTADTYDRKGMLTEIADGSIVPAHATLEQRASALEAQVDLFTTQGSLLALEGCRSAWIDVALAWQDARAYDFGPAEGLFGNLSENLGTYPASAEKIEGFITAQDTSLSGFDRDARGIYGMEYLLFSGSAEEVLAAFAEAPWRQAYLRSVARDVHRQVTTVYQGWTNGYRDEFISRNGTDPGSGTSLLFNNMVRSFEQLKNYALGLPLGKIAGQTGPEPTKVEGYYSGRSIQLVRRHYAAIMRTWKGLALDGSQIRGFRSYLETVPGGPALIDQTTAQDAAIEAAFGVLQDSEIMSDLIVTDPARLESLHTECQKMTRFLKSDLSSLLGIAITYSSGDGD